MSASSNNSKKPSSMTGFARVTKVIGLRTFEVILRAVNHRFLDFSPKVPREIQALEGKLRAKIQAKIDRGRIDLLVSIKEGESNPAKLEVNKDKIATLVAEYNVLSKSIGIKDPDPEPFITQLLLRELQGDRNSSIEVLSDAEQNEFLTLFDSAVDVLVSERLKEGVELIAEVKMSLDNLYKNIDLISTHSEASPKRYQEKLLSRLKSIVAELNLDSARIATECAIQAERIDIAEEISRAKAHIKACTPLLELSGQGKQLEFFAQELHREFTTLSNKSQDAEIQAIAVASRVEVEKIREQAQNLE